MANVKIKDLPPISPLSAFKHFIEKRSDLKTEVMLTSREKESSLVCLD